MYIPVSFGCGSPRRDIAFWQHTNYFTPGFDTLFVFTCEADLQVFSLKNLKHLDPWIIWDHNYAFGV